MAEKYKTTKKRTPLRRKRCKLGVNKNTGKCLKKDLRLLGKENIYKCNNINNNMENTNKGDTLQTTDAVGVTETANNEINAEGF